MRPADLRAAFPVLERVAYLNAGTDGPVPARGERAAAERLRRELERGRSGPEHRTSLNELRAQARRRLAELLGCGPGTIALTGSTTEGINAVLSGLDLGRGDELLTTGEEHPGLLAPLAATALRTGARVREVPFGELPGEVRPATRLVACSHVSWVTGRVIDTAVLAATEAPVLLDGAQGLGAIRCDVGELGCDFYAAAGQKWLCGPDGTGCLYVLPERLEELRPAWTGFESLSDPGRPLDLELHDDARRLERSGASGALTAWLVASLELFADVGWPTVHERAVALAARLADGLRERGVDVAARGDSTLVSWSDPDPAAAVRRLAAEGIVVRDIPGRGLVRASVGAWSSEEELDRLARVAA
jgi:L-cysteine/cystine lyase